MAPISRMPSPDVFVVRKSDNARKRKFDEQVQSSVISPGYSGIVTISKPVSGTSLVTHKRIVHNRVLEQ